MLHFNPLAAEPDNLCFTYEESDVYDDFCNGDRMKRIQESIPKGSGQLNAVMYFDGIQADETGFVSVDGGIVLGAFFRKEAREQNEAMRSICSFVEVRCCFVRRLVELHVCAFCRDDSRTVLKHTERRSHRLECECLCLFLRTVFAPPCERHVRVPQLTFVVRTKLS
jgi:hypothetical protein